MSSCTVFRVTCRFGLPTPHPMDVDAKVFKFVSDGSGMARVNVYPVLIQACQHVICLLAAV